MSEGPIKRWRDGFKVAPASTNPAIALHYVGPQPGRAYCGHRGGKTTDGTRYVDCSACLAALRADEKLPRT